MSFLLSVAQMLGSLVGSAIRFFEAEGLLMAKILLPCTFLVFVIALTTPVDVSYALTALIYIMGLGVYGSIHFKKWVDSDTPSAIE